MPTRNNSTIWIILYKMRMPFITILLSYTISIIGLVLLNGVDANGNPYKMSIFDAFYFISYTATTIGFGELPYAFSYSQRIWVIFLIYLTVISWFYAIGTLVTLLQDKLFIEQIKKGKFIRDMKSLKEDFIIVLGYNLIIKAIIKQALYNNLRVVVIEKDIDSVNELLLENFTPSVFVLNANIYDPNALSLAGIKLLNCKSLVSLLSDDELNLRIAYTAKILNPNVILAIKSTTTRQTNNLMDIGVDIIENPFEIISDRIDIALNAPSILKLQKWLFKEKKLDAEVFQFPKGKYIVCGYGRMGKKMQQVFEKNNLEVVFIEININKKVLCLNDNLIIADGYDEDILIQAGIKDASGIIIGTNNDVKNLSILAIVRKLNLNIVTIVRENKLDDFTLFNKSNIDYIFMPSKLLITKTTNAIINPLIDRFSKMIQIQTEQWGKNLLDNIFQKIGITGKIIQMDISFDLAPQIVLFIRDGNDFILEKLLLSRANNKEKNKIIPLLLKRANDEFLLPNESMKLKENDKILFLADNDGIDDMESIALNYKEFNYIMGI